MHEVRRLAGLSLALLLLSGAAGAQDAPASSVGPGVRRLADALALVAATRGEAPALALSRDLPERLREALRAMAASDRAADIRQLGALDVQAAMLPTLVDETPGAREALDAFAATHARLEKELAGVEREVERVRSAAAALQRDAAAQAIASRLALAARKGGPELLLLAAQAPLLEADLALLRDAPGRYAALTRHFERRVDPLVGPTLAALLAVRDQAPRELRAAGDQGEVHKALEDCERRMQWAAQRLAEAAGTAVEGVRLVRDEELQRVGPGQQRGAELQQALDMVTAYRRQFDAAPALKAMRWVDVYEDRASTRVHIWLPGEGKWVQGPPRVDPVSPVVDALLRSGEPDLRARACDAGAIARLYVLFDRRAERPPGPLPFSEGWARLVRNAQALAQRLRAVRADALAQGLDAAALDAALEARLGVALELLGEDGAPAAGGAGGPAGSSAGPDERVARRLGAAVLRAAVERGPEAGADVARTIDEALAEAERVRFEPATFVIEGRPAGAAVDLVWEPSPGTELLLPPPERVAAGAPDRVSVVLVGKAQASIGCVAYAYAAAGDQVVAGRTALRPRGTAQLVLAAAPGPSLVTVGRLEARGLRILQVPRDAPGLALHLEVPGGPRGRPLQPAPGGAWAALTPDEPGGGCVVVGLDAKGEARARLELQLPPARGVQVGSDGPGGPWWVAPGGKLEARVTSGGAPLAGQHAFRVEGPGGVAYQATRETLRWTVDLPPGRYRVAVEQPGIEAAPLAVTAAPPRVVATLDPNRAAPKGEATVPAGALVWLRLDAWPVLLAEEVRRVRWTLEGGPSPVTATTWASAADPAVVCRLPLRLDAGAVAGPRKVVAQVDTARGTLAVEGRFLVGAAAAAASVDLRAPDGERLAALALGQGEGPLLRAQPAVKDATWVLLGPTGRARALSPRFDGQVPLAFEEHDLPGAHEAWVVGTGPDGRPLAGRASVLAHPPAALSVTAPAAARIGQEVPLAVTPPAGFEGPFKVRVEGAPWVEGTRATVLAKAENELALVLEDARGRRARGRVTFKGTREAAAEPVSTARFGIAANVTQRRIFAADHALLQNYHGKQNLPPDWVILELGPMPAAKVRDRMFATCPFDGASPDPQVAYRSKRFWSSLQESARKRFQDCGAAEGEVYDVLVSPSPAGEETNDALVARLIAEQAAWEFKLVRVRVARASGASADARPPRDPLEELRFFNATASGEGSGVERIEVPGPLGDLRLRPVLPPTIALGKPARMAFSVLSARGELPQKRRFPGGLEAVLPEAVLCPELEVSLAVEEQPVGTVTRRVGRAVGGVDVGVRLEPTGTDRAPFPGQPRRAERYRIVVEPFTAEPPATLEHRFEPIPPGLLQPEPRTLVVTVRARLLPAVPRERWPEARPLPEAAVTIEGAEYVVVREHLPDVVVELVATYQRQAPDGPKPWPAALPPMKSVRADASMPEVTERAADALKRAERALASSDLDQAEAFARRAVYVDPEDPGAWAVLADVLLERRRSAEALGRARWSLGLGPTARAAIVAAEAAFQDGQLDEAQEALGSAGTPDDAALRARLARLRRQLGM